MGRGAGGDAGQRQQAKGRHGGRWGASGGPAGSAPTVGSGAQPSDAGPRLGWGAALPAFPALTPAGNPRKRQGPRRPRLCDGDAAGRSYEFDTFLRAKGSGRAWRVMSTALSPSPVIICRPRGCRAPTGGCKDVDRLLRETGEGAQDRQVPGRARQARNVKPGSILNLRGCAQFPLSRPKASSPFSARGSLRFRGV